MKIDWRRRVQRWLTFGVFYPHLWFWVGTVILLLILLTIPVGFLLAQFVCAGFRIPCK